MAAADVAAGLADVVSRTPRNAIVEIGGPQRLPMSQAVQRALEAHGDARRVVPDAQAPYFGSALDDASLVAGADAQLGGTSLDAWLANIARMGDR